MDIWTATRIVARRWYIALGALVLCIAVGSTIVSSAEARYSSTASIVLLPPNLAQPPERDAATDVNPFLQSGVALTASAVANAANSDRTAQRLVAEGLVDVDFEVVAAQDRPLIFMTVESNDEAATDAAIAVVVESVEMVLQEQQVEANSPDDQLVTAQLLAPPPESPVESLSARSRLGMAVVVASALVIVTSALLFDTAANALARMAQRRQEEEEFAATLDDDDAFAADSEADDEEFFGERVVARDDVMHDELMNDRGRRPGVAVGQRSLR
jgi:hypothetical protein